MTRAESAAKAKNKGTAVLELLRAHQAELAQCQRCPHMIGPVVLGTAVVSDILLVGQAPGVKEPLLGRPFAWTAGKNLFKWFGTLGVDEATFRREVYMAAVCRCFPGKLARGGDRVPSPVEMAECAPWLERELELIRPQLVIPVGRLAIERLLFAAPLVELIGQIHPGRREGHTFDIIPLPHPSGASTWVHRPPGKELLASALRLIAAHPAWLALQKKVPRPVG